MKKFCLTLFSILLLGGLLCLCGCSSNNPLSLEEFALNSFNESVLPEYGSIFGQCGLDDLNITYSCRKYEDQDKDVYIVEISKIESEKIKDLVENTSDYCQTLDDLLEEIRSVNYSEYTFTTDEGQTVNVEFCDNCNGVKVYDSEGNSYWWEWSGGAKVYYMNDVIISGSVYKPSDSSHSTHSTRKCHYCNIDANWYCANHYQWECPNCHLRYD